MKALVIGATGLVGHCIWRQWRELGGAWDVSGTFRERNFPGMEKLDISDAEALERCLQRAEPRVIVLTASNPFVDYCQTHPEQTRKVNVEGTLKAAEAAKKAGAKFVFFSSDYVFDGSSAPYSEEDPVSPLNAYGRQKVEAERGVAAITTDHLIVRISGAFGWETARKNFVMQILDRSAEKGPLPAARDVRYHPTYAFNIPGVLKELIEINARGIFHVVGAQELTRYDFAMEVVRVFGLDPGRVKPAAQRDLGSPTPRPACSSLKTDKVSAAVRAPLWGAAQALEHMRAAAEDWQRHLNSAGYRSDHDRAEQNAFSRDAGPRAGADGKPI